MSTRKGGEKEGRDEHRRDGASGREMYEILIPRLGNIKQSNKQSKGWCENLMNLGVKGGGFRIEHSGIRIRGAEVGVMFG